MTEQKHTPGPWSIRKEYSGGYRESYIVVGPSGALHSTGGDAGTMRNPEPYSGVGFKKEDAALAAAAPDLLEVMECVLASYPYPDSVYASNMRVVIEMAYGREPRDPIQYGRDE